MYSDCPRTPSRKSGASQPLRGSAQSRRARVPPTLAPRLAARWARLPAKAERRVTAIIGLVVARDDRIALGHKADIALYVPAHARAHETAEAIPELHVEALR